MQRIRSECEFASLLAPHVDGPVVVQFTHSRRVIARTERRRRATFVRLHRFFAEAPNPVCALLGTWLESGGKPNEALGAWIDEQLQSVDAFSRQSFVPDHRAVAHSIAAIYDELLETEFDGVFSEENLPLVTWGRRGRTRAKKTIRLGSFERERNIVRVHAVLDQSAVPQWFVSYVMFHELLHAIHLKDVLAGEDPHGPTFCARESQHPDFWRAGLWLRFNLPALLESASSGEPIGGGSQQLELYEEA